MRKRGQLTIFIIISILIVILIISYTALKTNVFNSSIKDSEVLRESITDCLDLNTQYALRFITYQGGYNNPPEKHFSFSPTFFPYYYYEGQNIMPTLEEIEIEMAQFVKNNLENCVSEIKRENFEIDYQTPEVKVNINEDGVSFIINMPISITKDESKITLDLRKKQIFYESKLYHLYQVSKFFVEDQLENPEDYCITCIADLCKEYGIKFYIFPITDDVYIMMSFEDKNDPLILNFVNKYE